MWPVEDPSPLLCSSFWIRRTKCPKLQRPLNIDKTDTSLSKTTTVYLPLLLLGALLIVGPDVRPDVGPDVGQFLQVFIHSLFCVKELGCENERKVLCAFCKICKNKPTVPCK